MGLFNVFEFICLFGKLIQYTYPAMVIPRIVISKQISEG